MDSVLIESPIAAKSLTLTPSLLAPNYSFMLKESVDRFLASIHSQALADFSSFRSIFSRLMQSTADPPLEIILFYCAVTYHESLSSSSKTPLDRALAVKNLLQFLAACSASCGGVKSIALLAPVVAELYWCVMEEGRIGGKEGKKLKREIEGLSEAILSYVSICRGKSEESGGEELLSCFRDLVRVWTVGRGGGGSGMEVFFPLISREVRGRLEEDGCGVEYLAGVVIAEALMLRLCLKVRASGVSREELHKELRVWAVSSVTVFRSHVFFDILLRLLLEPTLPVTSLLDSNDINLIRDTLYDVVILVDYSFLNPGMNVDQSYDFMRSIAVRRLIVTHDAIRIAREKGDHGKAISYMGAFSTSCLPNQIIKWVANQAGTGKTKKPDVNTPQTFLEWLLSLEDQGMRVFEDSIPELRAKLMLDKSKTTSVVSVINVDTKEIDADLFFVDKRGHAAEDEEMQSVDDTAFLAAARSMKSPEINGRKRKEVGDKEYTPAKFTKHKVHYGSTKDYIFPLVGDGVSSGSEVDNPLSDDEMDED